jgi:hypothetical protein
MRGKKIQEKRPQEARRMRCCWLGLLLPKGPFAAVGSLPGILGGRATEVAIACFLLSMDVGGLVDDANK